MRNQILQADDGGGFFAGGGVGFHIEEWGDGARFPLVVRPDGVASREMRLTGERVVRCGPFATLQVMGALPKSRWVVTLLADYTEEIGAQRGAGFVELLRVNLFDQLLPFGVRYYLPNKPDVNTGALTVFDVTRFRQVHAVASLKDVQGDGGSNGVVMRLHQLSSGDHDGGIADGYVAGSSVDHYRQLDVMATPRLVDADGEHYTLAVGEGLAAKVGQGLNRVDRWEWVALSVTAEGTSPSEGVLVAGEPSEVVLYGVR